MRPLFTFIQKFERNQLFSEDEGWFLFRVAAIGEACGWTLLIAGILWERAGLPGGHVPVLLAGRTHGMLFLLYALAAAGLYPTLRWSRIRAFVALAASAPPYGSLLFELWASHVRNSTRFRNYRRCVLLAKLTQ